MLFHSIDALYHSSLPSNSDQFQFNSILMDRKSIAQLKQLFVLMVSCLRNIFYEFLIGRQRSYRAADLPLTNFSFLTRFSWKRWKRDWEFVITISFGVSRSLLCCPIPSCNLQTLVSIRKSRRRQLHKCAGELANHKRNVYQQHQPTLASIQMRGKNSFAIKTSDRKEFLSLCVDFHALSVLW